MALLPSSWEAEALQDPMALPRPRLGAEASLDPTELQPRYLAAEVSLDPTALHWQNTQTRGAIQCSRISIHSTCSISLVHLPAVDTTAIELCFVRVPQCV